MSGHSHAGCAFLSRDESGLVVLFDLAVYRLNAVKKAAYKFGDRCHIHIELEGDSRAKVSLKAKKVLDNPEHLAGEFCNEVLDQELREVVAAETEGVRNLLMAQAFSRTSLIEGAMEVADFRGDPAGIREPDLPHGTIS